MQIERQSGQHDDVRDEASSLHTFGFVCELSSTLLSNKQSLPLFGGKISDLLLGRC